MKIAVLTRPDNWYFRDLVRAGTGNHDVSCVDFTSLCAQLDQCEQAGTGDFELFDVVLVRSMPLGSLEQVIFRMDVLARWQATGTPIVNSPKALEAAIDKYLSLSLLKTAGLQVPHTIVCQTVEQAMAGFESLGRDAVIKPIFGGEGHGIMRVADADLALQAFESLVNRGAVIYLQRFVDHGNQDVRLLVVGPQIFSMSRSNAKDWRTNASRGAICQPWQSNEREVTIAQTAATAIGAEIAGVDLITDADGRTYVLEINAVPGWRALAEVTGVDIASAIIDYLAKRVESNSPPPVGLTCEG